MWRCLDQSPQSKVKLPRAIASPWDFKRQEKSVGPNPAETVAVAAKRWIRPALEPVAQKDKEGYDWLLLQGWACKVDWELEAKTIWGRTLPEVIPSINGKLVRLYGFTLAEIMLGFVPKRKMRHKEIRPDILPKVMQETTHRDKMGDRGRSDRGVS